MGNRIALTTSDNHTLGAYRADPIGAPKGGMVVIQEIFGVNNHIRNVCDRLAETGYVAVAPAVFDRFVRDFESGYTPDEVANARSYIGNVNWDLMTKDMEAAKNALKDVGPVGVIGFCLGGTAAFLASARIPGFSAAVSMYGGAIAKFGNEKPQCPIQMHFGEKDDGIPMATVDEIRKQQPEAEIYTYSGAPHGFACDERQSFRQDSANLAWQRTHQFLEKHIKR